MLPLPSVSIVMPIRNEADFIARSLGAVLAQDYPADRIEVLVADGTSTDGTLEIVSRLTGAGRRVRVIPNPKRIVATGLNLAIAEATGDIIIRVDGHCEVAPDYVRRCVEHLVRGEADGVGGPLETVGQTDAAAAIAVAMSSPFGVGNSAFRTVSDRTMIVDTVAFPAYTREVLQKVGPFDMELVRNQDDEYNYRLRKMGGRLLLAADVRSRYFSRSSLRSLWRQYFQYGYWKVRVLQKHPRQMRWRQFVPFAFVVSLLAGSALTPWTRIPLTATIVAYVGANLAATALSARRLARWRALSALSAAFAILHLSYGWGFLVGLAAFRNRWGSASNEGAGRQPDFAVRSSR
ncbi:MAG: glycosyltransferase [Acidobacteria bacterium]|nr:glycosyltransferase [Acidobacteriota bacterium]